MTLIKNSDMIKIQEMSNISRRIENVEAYLKEIKKYEEGNNFILLKPNFNNLHLDFQYPLCVDISRFSSFCEREIDLNNSCLIDLGSKVQAFKPSGPIKGKDYE